MPGTDIDNLDEINPHLALARSESSVSAAERAWLSWVAQVEKIVGHEIDGDQDRDGYSLDFAHDFFINGDSPEDYADDVVARRLVVRDSEIGLA